MKIRTQFFFLISGIIFIPFLVIATIALTDYYGSLERSIVPGYSEISAITATEIDKESWNRLSAYLARKPDRIDNIVLDRNLVILYSTIPQYGQRSTLPEGELISMIRNSDQRYLFQFDKPLMKGTPDVMVLTRVLRRNHRPPDPFVRVLRSLVIVLATLFTFAGAMTIAIARSITRSVTVLEESTRRIAAGELDLAIKAKGSNEITSLTVSLNRMRLALKDEQARRSRFIMGVTHDLKTPLALIKGYAEAISDGIADDPEAIRKSLDIVGTKVDQLEGMIDDLIGFVKLDRGEWRHHLEKRTIAPILRSFAHRMTEDANLLERNFESDISLPDSVSAQIDVRLFLRALENIANNAIRYTPSGGTITLAARLNGSGDGSAAVVSVTDNGGGIAESELPHIFDLFYRGSSSRREEGMGLGLSIVKSVADSHGWSLDVKSEIGKGTVFSIIIPLA